MKNILRAISAIRNRPNQIWRYICKAIAFWMDCETCVEIEQKLFIFFLRSRYSQLN